MAEPKVHRASIPVSLTGGAAYTDFLGELPSRMSERLVALSMFGKRNIEHGRVRTAFEYRIERDEKDAAAVEKKKETTKQLRRAAKGLWMELVVGGTLCLLDHPEKVLVNCSVDEKTKAPSRAAAGRQSDIVITLGPSSRFQIVCEVSANKTMSDPKYREQLDNALSHAETHHESADVEVTFVLLVNLRESATDTDIHKEYRSFMDDNSTTLWLFAPIRFVLMEAADLAAVVNSLHYEELLDCPGQVLADALDLLHEKTLKEKLPGPKSEPEPEPERWIEQLVITAIKSGTERGSAHTDMFPGPRKPEFQPPDSDSE